MVHSRRVDKIIFVQEESLFTESLFDDLIKIKIVCILQYVETFQIFLIHVFVLRTIDGRILL